MDQDDSNKRLIKENNDYSELIEYENNQFICKSCKTISIQCPNHCFECNICVETYHHHCMWVGKVNNNY